MQKQTPALIRCSPETAALKVAGLTVLDRLVVAVHRAGYGPIRVVCEGPLPILRRAPALGITVEVNPKGTRVNGRLLWMRAEVLVQPMDLKRLGELGGRLVNAAGHRLPVGLLEPASIGNADHQPKDAVIGELDLAQRLDSLPERAAAGVAEQVVDQPSAREASRRLWASLRSSSDGLVDRYFNRPVGRPLSKLLVHTAVTPNQVSVSATLLGVLSAWCFGLGTTGAFFLGAVLLQVSAVVDCVDGDLARVTFRESPLGKWLDLVGDQIVHVGLFAGIGIGLSRAGSEAPVLGLAWSAGVGVVISFLVVLRGLLLPQRLTDTPLQKLIDATTNRDFSVLLIALVCVGRLEWFMWATGIGVHVFWMIALALQLGNRGEAEAMANRNEKGA